MIYLSTDGASVRFDFENSQHWLYGDGSVTVPLNVLTLVLDESGMATFKKPDGDTFIAAPIAEFDGFDEDTLAEWFASNGCGTPVADGIQFKVVNSLPAVGSSKFLYLVNSPDGWEEWAYQDGQWIQFGVMQTIGYNGKDAIKIAKSATTASAYTVSLKIDDNDQFLQQSSGGVRDYANLRTSADTYGHQHIVLSGYGEEVSNIKIDDYTGLSAISANNITDEISLIIDPTSNTALTQSNAGLKLTTEDNVKTASASTRPVETQEVYHRFDDLEIQSAQTVSSTTYQLYSLDEPKNVKIEVPNDQYVSAVTVDNANQQILLDLKKADGSVQVLSGDATEILFEDDAQDGLEIVSHQVKVKIDANSNTGLTVSTDGVKLTTEDNVKTASASTRPVETSEVFSRFDDLEIQSAQTVSSTTYQLYSLDEPKDTIIEVPNDQYVSAVTVDNTNQQILLDLKKADGSVDVLSGDATEVIFESDLADGLTADSHSAKVLIDPASNSALTVSATGVKLDVDQTIDSASTNPLENKEVYKRFNELHIESGQTTSSTTYQLYSLDVAKDELIEVPNDQYVSAVTIDNANQQVLLDLKKADGSVDVLSGDATEVIFESDLSDGLTAVSHSAKVLIDSTSNSGLTVSADGVKLTTESNVKTASASTRPVETQEVYNRFDELEIRSARTSTADTYQLYSLGEAKDDLIEVKDTFVVVTALPSTNIDEEIIYILEYTDPETSEKTYTQFVYYNGGWAQASAAGTPDQFVSAITVDNVHQQILLDLIQPDGTVNVLSGDATQIIFEDDLSDGLTAVSHNAKVLIDANSNSGLTVSATGVKLTTESNVKTASASTRPVEAQEVYNRFDELEIQSARTTNADTYQLYSLGEAKDDLIEVKDTFHIVSALPATGDEEVIYILEETDPETSAKTYTQWIYTDDDWAQTSAAGGGGEVYSAGTNIDIYKAQPSDSFWTISGSQVVDLTQAQYDALTTKDPNKLYNITDAVPFIPSAYTNINISSATTGDNQIVQRISAEDFQVLTAVPTTATTSEKTIYAVRKGTSPDYYYELYGMIDNAIYPLGDDLSGYVLDAGTY